MIKTTRSTPAFPLHRNETISDEFIEIWGLTSSNEEDFTPKENLSQIVGLMKSEQVLARLWLVGAVLREIPNLDEIKKAMGELVDIIDSNLGRYAAQVYQVERKPGGVLVSHAEHFMEKAYLAYKRGDDWLPDFGHSQMLRQANQKAFMHPIAQVGHAQHPYLTAREALSYLDVPGPAHLGDSGVHELITNNIEKNDSYSGLSRDVASQRVIKGLSANESHIDVIESYFAHQALSLASPISHSPWMVLSAKLMSSGWLPNAPKAAVDRVLQRKTDPWISRHPEPDSVLDHLSDTLHSTFDNVSHNNWGHRHGADLEVLSGSHKTGKNGVRHRSPKRFGSLLSGRVRTRF